MANIFNDDLDIGPLIENYRQRLINAEVQATDAAVDNYKNAMSRVKEDLQQKEKRQQEALLEDLAEYDLMLRLEGLGDSAAYEQALKEDQANKDLKYKLDLLEKTSKEEVRKREKVEAELLKKKKKLTGKLDDDEQKKLDASNKKARKETFTKEAFKSFGRFKEALENPELEVARTAGENLNKTLKQVGKNITEGLNQINNAIKNYAKLQTSINTRLQGLPGYKANSAFSTITGTLGSITYSPLVSAETLYENVNTLASEGIGYNIEERAFLMTIKDAVATTFDANSESLRRLIRIQQEDSTAARLGMESYLTRWLNAYLENTEYLTQTFDTVADNLLEATAVLGSNYGAGASAEFEYVVQKWLGALTGLGLSNQTATAIAQALGEIGSGNISNLGSSGIQNLLVMAASKTSLGYSELLTKGLDAVDTNKLLYGLVDYMQTLAAYPNNVVKSALANTFGVTISDLISVSKLTTDEMKNIYENMMSYSNMYGELSDQLNSVTTRMGVANLLENAFSNLTYQTGMEIAANPLLYATWKITDLIQGVTGGINIPFVTAFGSGIDLEATVENLMKIGIVGMEMLGNIGQIAGAVSTVFNGASLLQAIGISENASKLDRGTGLSDYNIKSGGIKKRTSGTTVSASGYIGNTDADTYYDSTLAAANDQNQTELNQMKEETRDPVVEYLMDLEFANGFRSLVSNVETMTNEGIIINKFRDSTFNDTFTSFFRDPSVNIKISSQIPG